MRNSLPIVSDGQGKGDRILSVARLEICGMSNCTWKDEPEKSKSQWMATLLRSCKKITPTFKEDPTFRHTILLLRLNINISWHWNNKAKHLFPLTVLYNLKYVISQTNCYWLLTQPSNLTLISWTTLSSRILEKLNRPISWYQKAFISKW